MAKPVLLTVDDDREVVAYCGSGVSACMNVLAMEHAGLPTPLLYVASWSGWSADPDREAAVGDPVEEVTGPPAQFVPGGDVVPQRRPREVRRAGRGQPPWLDRRDRAAGRAVQHHVPARAQRRQAGVERVVEQQPRADQSESDRKTEQRRREWVGPAHPPPYDRQQSAQQYDDEQSDEQDQPECESS